MQVEHYFLDIVLQLGTVGRTYVDHPLVRDQVLIVLTRLDGRLDRLVLVHHQSLIRFLMQNGRRRSARIRGGGRHLAIQVFRHVANAYFQIELLVELIQVVVVAG